jgi:arylformamidase
MTRDLIDITPPIRDSMPVYPGNPGVSVRRVRDVAEGAHSTLSEVTMGTHTGTHVDAPGHFIAGARLLEEMPLDALVGRARVLRIDADAAIEVDDLKPHCIREGERVLLRTHNSDTLWAADEFSPDYVYLSTEAALYLGGLRLPCLGVDYLSVGGFQSNGTKVHRALLSAGTLLIEGLDLSAAEPGEYELMCLPLRIDGVEAAPARAVLRTFD